MMLARILVPCLGAGASAADEAVVETTVYDITSDSSDNGWAGFTVTNNVDAGNLAAASGDWVRLTVEFTSFSNGATCKVYFGQHSGGGDLADFNGNQVNVTFSGLDTITGDGSTLEYLSDWVQLGEAYDDTIDYVIAAQFTGGTVNLARSTSGTNSNNTQFKAGADAATTDKSGYTFHQSNAGHLLMKIEIATDEP